LTLENANHQSPTEMVHATDSSHKVIDFTSAVARWGDSERLYKAIAQFCEEFKRNPLQEGSSDSQSIAHRFKGAAANLGLNQVTQILANIEKSPRPKLPQLAALALAITEVEEQIRHRLSGQAFIQNGSDAKDSATPAHQVPLALLQRIATASKHSTIDDEGLAQLQQLLPATLWSELENTLDQFDFDAATELLEQWMNSATWVLKEV
jgi:HPt (histidine-containing phosphotransfer) domain-containing protein